MPLTMRRACTVNGSRHNKSKSNPEIATLGNNGGSSNRHRPAPKVLWPALVAINGFGIAANHASALELGELTVQSSLGQPLRASVAYALGPGETIQSHCIFVQPPASTAALPTVRNTTASASNGVIRLMGDAPIREPILSLNLTVKCPGTANLRREYMVLVDLPTSVPISEATTTADPGYATVRRPEAASAPHRPARPAASNTAPIGDSSSYRVQPGDTLSGIAARIENRDISLWEAVDVIFAANPDAFIDNDRNRLRAGSLLVLPDMGPVSADVPARASDPRAVAPPQGNAPAVLAVPAQAPVTAGTDFGTPGGEIAGPAATASATAAPKADSAATLPPGAVPADADNPFVTTIEPGDGAISGRFGPARDVIPDTAVDPAAVRPAPRVSIAAGDGGEGLSSLAWLGGIGIAIILALLLFGRQLKERFGSPGDILPAGIKRGRRRSDAADDAEPVTPVAGDEPADGFESPIRVQPVALDADLGTGSGFDDDGEIDVAQDFGFCTSRDLYEDLDVEPAEQTARAAEETPADVFPPKRVDDRRFADTVIVEEEIPPGDETGEYEVSMIVDATRQPIAGIEDTTKDLHAVQVDTADNEALTGENLTLSREVDYKILEQDYEEELTATQALNAKRLKEAELVAGALDTTEAPTVEYALVDEELTMQLPNDDLEPTAEMPLDQEPHAEAPRSLEDSGVNAEVTTRLPAADNDETLEMDIESATVDTKKLRAS